MKLCYNNKILNYNFSFNVLKTVKICFKTISVTQNLKKKIAAMVKY